MPASNFQKELLESKYVLPVLEFVFDEINELELPEKEIKKKFDDLLNLIIEPNAMTEQSRQLNYGEEDIDLKEKMHSILGKIDDDDFLSLYQSLYVLSHEYYLNKNPDKPSDIEKAANIAQQGGLGLITHAELFDQTPSLLGKLSHRLIVNKVILSDEEIQQLVIEVIKEVKIKLLTPKEKEKEEEISLEENVSFLPAFYSNPSYWEEIQEAQNKALVEMLEKQAQEEEDEEFARALQNEADYDYDEKEEDTESEAELSEYSENSSEEDISKPRITP